MPKLRDARAAHSANERAPLLLRRPAQSSAAERPSDCDLLPADTTAAKPLRHTPAATDRAACAPHTTVDAAHTGRGRVLPPVAARGDKRKRSHRLAAPPLRVVRMNPERVASTTGCSPKSRLPEATWCRIQDMLASAKSLGDITKITLAFFKEHELVSRREVHGGSDSSSSVLPIVVPSSDVYNMLVPRKRRIYDVLHVLEGIGIIKRVRADDAAGTKGGNFLYFGRDAAIKQLAKIRLDAVQVVEMLWQSAPQTPSAEELDTALIMMCEEQGENGRWPCLTMTTAAFLSILFRHDKDQALALPGISSRLIGVKKSRDRTLDFSSESATVDGNRRVYDVVSVLASCDLVLVTVIAPSSGVDERDDVPDKISSRKHVRFNYAVFDDLDTLAIADVSADKLSRWLESERRLHASRSGKRRRTSQPRSLPTQCIETAKPSAQRKLSLGGNSNIEKAHERCQDGGSATSVAGVIEDQGAHAATSPLRIDIESILTFSADDDDHCDIHEYDGGADYGRDRDEQHHNEHSRHLQRCDSGGGDNDNGAHIEQLSPRQLTQSVREQLPSDALCPIIKIEPADSRDWWDDSLQDWLFEDALPPQDRLEWELMKDAPHMAALDQVEWGDSATPQPTRALVSQTSVEDVDLNCREAFPGDESLSTKFFAFSWNRLRSPTPLEGGVSGVGESNTRAS